MIYLTNEDSNSIGKAFEEFIAILLSKLGYKISNINIHKSGREIDVEAISKVTGEPIIAECKAHKEPLTGPDLSKFYGVYEHERKRKKPNLIGIMFSLSGFNSAFIEYYNEKTKEDKKTFKIYGTKEIIDFSVDADLISDDGAVRTLAKRYWANELGDTHLIIANSRLYRLQLLQKEGVTTNFMLFRSKCEDVTEEEIHKIKSVVDILEKVEPFNLSARKAILLALANNKDPSSLIELKSKSNQSEDTILNELNYLNERTLINGLEGDQFTLTSDINTFCEVSKELLHSEYGYDFILTPYFSKFNDSQLISYCFSRRKLRITPTEHISMTSIFQISPKSLYFALFGSVDDFINTWEHAEKLGLNWDKFNIIGISRFLTVLITNLVQDLHNNKNKALIKLQPVVCYLEDYKVSLANTYGKVFEIKSGGITSLLKVSPNQTIKKGQLVSYDDIGTNFNCTLAQFRLLPVAEIIKELELIFNEAETNKTIDSQLALMAFNIASCYTEIKNWALAKDWALKGKEKNADLNKLNELLLIIEEELNKK